MIIIGTHPGSPFLENCLRSLRGLDYLVVCNDGYECGKLRWIKEHLDIPRFLFLPDSVEILQQSWIGTVFSSNQGNSASINASPCLFGSFMGFYQMETLRQIHIPTTRTKVEAVQAELFFSAAYMEANGNRPVPVIFPEMRDGVVFEEKCGRMNMVLSSWGLKKYKGCYNIDIAREIDRNKRAIALGIPV